MPQTRKIDEIIRALGFLSRLPLPARHFANYDGSLTRISAMFPVAGLLIALIPAIIILTLSSLGANPALVALIALSTLIAITGALHEDGLADSADGFGARGGRDHMLDIMKDSRIGTYGVLALMLSFALKATALTHILTTIGGFKTGLVLLASAAASRAAMVWHWHALPPARTSGIAATSGAPDAPAKTTALISGCIGFVGLMSFVLGPIATISALIAMTATTNYWTSSVRKRLEGHTGDTIGATQQLTETTCLITLALFL